MYSCCNAPRANKSNTTMVNDQWWPLIKHGQTRKLFWILSILPPGWCLAGSVFFFFKENLEFLNTLMIISLNILVDSLALQLNSYCCAYSRKPPSLPVFTNLPLPCPSIRQSIPWFCIEILAPGEKVQQCIIRYCHSELCPAIGSWVNWIQMNALQVIWILTTAIHVIWIQAVQLKNGANSGDVNPSRGGPAFWPAGGARVTRRDYRGIAHCWPWLATRPQFLPKPFLRFWRHVSLGGHLGRDRSGTVWRFPSQDFTNLIYYICE